MSVKGILDKKNIVIPDKLRTNPQHWGRCNRGSPVAGLRNYCHSIKEGSARAIQACKPVH